MSFVLSDTLNRESKRTNISGHRHHIKMHENREQGQKAKLLDTVEGGAGNRMRIDDEHKCQIQTDRLHKINCDSWPLSDPHYFERDIVFDINRHRPPTTPPTIQIL